MVEAQDPQCSPRQAPLPAQELGRGHALYLIDLAERYRTKYAEIQLLAAVGMKISRDKLLILFSLVGGPDRDRTDDLFHAIDSNYRFFDYLQDSGDDFPWN
jgi:hypothetical protein